MEAVMDRQLILRMGTQEDIPALSLLFDMANFGDVKRIWTEEAKEGESWLDICRRRMMETAGEIYFGKAVVAQVDGNVAGALFFFNYTPPESFPDISGMPLYLRIFAEMRTQMKAGVLLRDIGVFPEYRGMRLATKMIDAAINTGVAAGLRYINVIVHDSNILQHEHYYKRGFNVVFKSLVINHVYFKPDSYWYLLILDTQRPDTDPAN